DSGILDHRSTRAFGSRLCTEGKQLPIARRIRPRRTGDQPALARVCPLGRCSSWRRRRLDPIGRRFCGGRTMDDRFSRRGFLAAGAAGAAVLLGNALPVWSGDQRRTLPQRTLGRTKVQVPILGLGTVSIGNMGNEKEAVTFLNRALDMGVTYID